MLQNKTKNSEPTSHHLSNIAVGINTANVFWMGWVDVIAKKESLNTEKSNYNKTLWKATVQ